MIAIRRIVLCAILLYYSSVIEKSHLEFYSPKTAARDTARRILGGASIAIIERCTGTSIYEPAKHEAYPRLIELKPERYTLTTVLFERVAEKILVGEDDEVRLPALARVRDTPREDVLDSPHFSEKDIPFLHLRDDWYEAKDEFTACIQEVLDDPQNAETIAAYREIAEDIATDPNAEDPYFSGDVQQDLHNRLNVSAAFELEASAYFLLKWGLEVVPRHEYPTADDRRKFLIKIADFFTKFSELEGNHSNRYYFYSDAWNDSTLTATDAGVILQKDYIGNYQLALKKRVSKPDKAFGRPIGCPMGFDPTPTTDEFLPDPEQPHLPSAIKRLLTAYVNEAYDRGLLE